MGHMKLVGSNVCPGGLSTGNADDNDKRWRIHDHLCQMNQKVPHTCFKIIFHKINKKDKIICTGVY